MTDAVGVEEIPVAEELLVDDEPPDEGDLDPADDYVEGTTADWLESLPSEDRPPAFRDDA